LGVRRANARTEKNKDRQDRRQTLQAGDSLLVNCGTSTIFFAEQLAKQGTFTIVTNATLVAGDVGFRKSRANTPFRRQLFGRSL
jgi:DeoR/GlpR family transcriptional regulator of sugar metabolism